jgi:ABC-2 type transport system ATP-binding protein
MEAIQVTHLSKTFQVFKRNSSFLRAFSSLFHRQIFEVKAVDNISFHIKPGELVGFIGPNGAGKTTTLKCLSGLLYPTQGKISVFGFIPSRRKKEFLKQISLVMGQKNQLWWDLPAMDTFLLNKEIYEVRKSEFDHTLEELVTLLDVKQFLQIPVRQLSLGQRMKMELIASLIHNPKILFLDEPTIGLDVVMQKKIRDFIISYNKKYKATILLTSHYMSDVKEMCKRVIIIDHGSILYNGKLNKLVDTYVSEKLITLILSEKISIRKFLVYGHVNSYEGRKMVLRVPKKDTKKIATILLTKYPVEDLTVEEPEIEDVIRLVFNKKQPHGKI